MITRILLALFAVCFVLASDALAICPIAIVPPARTRVTIVHRYAAPMVAVRPMIAVQAAPVVSVPVVEAPAPDVEVVAPVPTVTYQQRMYYRSTPVVSYAAPVVGVDAVVGQTGAQRRH